MFKKLAIKKYGTKLRPMLKKRYGDNSYYTASQVRSTVFQKDFSPRFLPLGYILFLNQQDLEQVILEEYPELDIRDYKQQVLNYVNQESTPTDLLLLSQL